MAAKKFRDPKVLKTLRTLYGADVPDKVPVIVELIAESIDRPETLPANIEKIATDKDAEDYRFHLIRMQLESELRVREDVDYHSRRLWVAQTIEKVIFGDLKTEGSKKEES
jgi:hypothetical protein